MNRQLAQLSAMAVVGALAVVALFAVAFFAANGAQAENVTTNAIPYETGNGDGGGVPGNEGGDSGEGGEGGGEGATPTPTPVPTRQSQPEDCDPDPAHAITGGAHALFESYWDEDDQNLVNNPCPPKVGHIVETVDGAPRVVGTSREASDINIESTVVHMPDGLRLRVVEQAEGQPGGLNERAGTYAVEKDSPLWQAYSSRDRNRFVWLLPEWEPETPEDELNEEDELIHIGFSAALLDPDDWEGNILWNFETVREPGFRPEDRGVVLVTADPTFLNIDWNSRNPDVQLIDVTPGEYEHRSWAFTKPGTYVLRVHSKGKPEDGNSLGLENTSVTSKSVTSDISHYTFHAGSLADLNVAVSANTEAPEAGGAVTYTVDAGNAGPDTAPHGEVTVSLPEGLTYDPVDTLVNTAAPADGAVTVTDNGDSGSTLTWQVGEMVDGYSARLSFKAHVGADTADQALEVTANIVARETLGHSEVAQLDPRDGDDTSTVIIIVTGTVNGPPLFNLAWSVEENAMPGTVVGRIKVVEPDEDDVLEYHFAGDGHADFVAVGTADGVEVRVAASLDYEAGPQSYNLVLGVTDNKGPAGGPDPSTDHTIGLMIAVTDVVDEASDIAFSVNPDEQAIGETVKFTVDILAPLPEGADNVTVHINGPGASHTVPNPTFPVMWEHTGSPPPGVKVYKASVSFDLKDKREHIYAVPVQVTWTPATGK